jgi:hypothetical protein
LAIDEIIQTASVRVEINSGLFAKRKVSNFWQATHTKVRSQILVKRLFFETFIRSGCLYPLRTENGKHAMDGLGDARHKVRRLQAIDNI